MKIFCFFVALAIASATFLVVDLEPRERASGAAYVSLGSQALASVPKRISDGRFQKLDARWKKHAKHLIASGKCDRYDNVIAQALPGDTFGQQVLKAQMLVESSCNPKAKSSANARGLFQLFKGIACKDVGMQGNLYDPTFGRTVCEGLQKGTLHALRVVYTRQ